MHVNDSEAARLLKAVDLELLNRGQAGSRGGERGLDAEGSTEGVTMSLEDVGLWSKFEEHTNEMIVTKSGRYMCTLLKYICPICPSIFSMYMFAPGGCFLYWECLSRVWTPTACTRCFSTSRLSKRIAGSTSTESGCPVARQNHCYSTRRTCIQTHPTLDHTGWRKTSTSAKWSLQTRCKALVKWVRIITKKITTLNSSEIQEFILYLS